MRRIPILVLWLCLAPAAVWAQVRIACPAGAVVCLDAATVDGLPARDLPVTFGQPFAKGDVPAGETLAATDGAGQALPLQVDQVATHTDGSLRHAVFTTILPQVKGRSARAGIALVRGPAEVPAPPPVDAAAAADAIEVVFDLGGGEGIWRATLAEALSGGAGKRAWLRGPLVTELGVRAPVRDAGGREHPLLSVLFHLRIYAGGQARTDVIVENVWSYGIRPATLVYDVAIRRGGETVFQADRVPHYHHARWRRTVWNRPPADIELRHDPAYLVESRSVPSYDTALAVSSRAIDTYWRKLAESDTSPMGSALVVRDMPMPGGRADIAPLPDWSVLWLLSQDVRQKAVMLANAEAGASAPVHYRDKASGTPLSLDVHPGANMLFGTGSGRDALPKARKGDTPWRPDANHQPSLSYLPYLVTGDRFHLEELHFWANWCMGSVDPKMRGRGKGLVYYNELRGEAWSLRTLGHAAWITPDSHPFKAYFRTRVEANVDWYLETIVNSRDPQRFSHLGFLNHRFNRDRVAPWQHDFMVLALAQLAEMEVPGARDFLHAVARFAVGRWRAEEEGYCRAMAPAYWLVTRRANGRVIQSWDELYAANWPDRPDCPSADDFVWGYPREPDGAVAMGRAALAAAASFGIPGAREQFDRLSAQIPEALARQAAKPAWAIVPRRQGGGP